MEKFLAQLIPKNWLANKNWEEFSRQIGENHISIRLRHLNPEINLTPELAKGYGQGKSISEYESIVYHGISTRRGSGMKDFFEGMTKMAESGLTPGVTPTSVQNLKNQYQKADVDISGKYDLDAIITIAGFTDEKIAESQLLSFQILPTHGFTEMPVPGMERTGIKNLGELLKSDYYKSAMKFSLSKEQFEQLEKGLPKMQEEIERASKQIKEQYKKLKAETGARYYQGKYLGFPAVFVQTENPKFKQSPMCLGLRINNFVVSGSLLYMLSTFPPGNTFCHSLTKFQKKTEVERIEGKVFRTIHILPVASALAAEGYFNKEEVEKIFKKLFTLLRE